MKINQRVYSAHDLRSINSERDTMELRQSGGHKALYQAHKNRQRDDVDPKRRFSREISSSRQLSNNQFFNRSNSYTTFNYLMPK